MSLVSLSPVCCDWPSKADPPSLVRACRSNRVQQADSPVIRDDVRLSLFLVLLLCLMSEALILCHPPVCKQGCGKTAAGGPVNIANEMAKIPADKMPSVAADGKISATLHQVNGSVLDSPHPPRLPRPPADTWFASRDGAGPYKLEVSPSGKGGDWIRSVSPVLPFPDLSLL